VRRISVGGTLARVAWFSFRQAAQEITEAGTFTHFNDLPNPDALFEQR
jgi:methylisocitrate lyase